MWRLDQARRSIAVFAATALCVGMLVQGAAAQTLTAKCDPTKIDTNNPVSCKQTNSITAVDQNGNAQTATQQVSVTYGNINWQGLNWGIGIAADFDLRGQRVTGALIDNANIVRVTDTSGNVGV